MRLAARVARVVVAVVLLSAGVQAGYKPVDISNIKGEQRERLTQTAKMISGFPRSVREAFLCEQLGLCFKKDGSMAMSCAKDSTRFRTETGSWYITEGGKVVPWRGWWKRAGHVTPEMWMRAFDQWILFPREYLLSFYPKEVEKIALNTAKYLLKTMPKEHRWMILASVGNMLYNDMGPRKRGREDWKIDNVVPIKIIGGEGRGYTFLDPEGKEHRNSEVVGVIGADHIDYWRWRWMVWRCENLVGSKDILELFPEEVEAMRKHFKGRVSKVKDEAKAKNDALMVAADEMMSSLTKSQRLSRIAKAVGLYHWGTHSNGGYNPNYHRLNPGVVIFLPDGQKCTWQEVLGEKPELLQQIPHEAILEFYRQPIEQMARNIGGERFKGMPPLLRDMLRAQLSRQLIKSDGSPAETEKSTCAVQTFDRSWQVPVNVPRDIEHTYFRSSAGQILPFNLYKTYERDYSHTISLVHLCARILGRTEAVKLVPPGGGAVLTAEQKHAWLAEKMGFCFTEDGEAAYQSERTANGNAVYVDAQGKVRKLSEVPGKDSAGWKETTNTALAVGYDKFTAPYEEELKRLAVQTSKHILGSMPPGLRQSWLAERNSFFFMPNASVPCTVENISLESGIRISFRGTGGGNYERCLYHDSSGKIVSATAVEAVWKKNRWWLLYYCETVAGIEAINKSFSTEVEPMRAAFQKSPFHKK